MKYVFTWKVPTRRDPGRNHTEVASQRLSENWAGGVESQARCGSGEPKMDRVPWRIPQHSHAVITHHSKMSNEHLKLDMSQTEILIFPINQFFFLPDFPIFISNATTHPVSQAKNLGLGLSSSLQPFQQVLSNLPTQYRNYQPNAPPWCRPPSFPAV